MTLYTDLSRLVRSLMERSADMNFKSYTNADRERRAREGRSPCKKPYCTGEYCLREPQLCRAWRIFNQYRKEMNKHDRRSEEKDS